MQPPTMPRPDLEALNINYRRIPILSLGRDVFLDTRLILRKLESRFPLGALGAGDTSEPELRALQRLLERWTTDAGVFQRAVQLIPLNLPNMQDPHFRKDRENFSGRPFNLEALKRARPEALAHMRDAFELLETTLLADGRQWVFKTKKPSLGDIEGKTCIFSAMGGLKLRI
jgi:glutathione S-transferase